MHERNSLKARDPQAGLSEPLGDKNRQFFIFLSVLIFLLQVSSFMYFFLLYDLFVTQLSSLSGGILFAVLMVSSYSVGYYLLARYSKQSGIQGQKSDPILEIDAPCCKNYIFCYRRNIGNNYSSNFDHPRNITSL
jgi:hypothetical protein